jgi:hypothetical protein
MSGVQHRPDSDISGCEAAQALLHATIATLRDEDVRRPSLLPGWTIGHVLIAQHVVRRWREVEFHHADLGLGFTYADFSPAYVERELADAAPPRWGGRTDWVE